jgi:hypothetical protein
MATRHESSAPLHAHAVKGRFRRPQGDWPKAIPRGARKLCLAGQCTHCASSRGRGLRLVPAKSCVPLTALRPCSRPNRNQNVAQPSKMTMAGFVPEGK